VQEVFEVHTAQFAGQSAQFPLSTNMPDAQLEHLLAALHLLQPVILHGRSIQAPLTRSYWLLMHLVHMVALEQASQFEPQAKHELLAAP